MSSSDRDMQAKVVEKGVGILEKMRELLSLSRRDRSIPPVSAHPCSKERYIKYKESEREREREREKERERENERAREDEREL